MDWVTPALVITGFILQGYVMTAVVTWKLSGIIVEVRKDISTLETAVKKEVADNRRELDSAFEQERRAWAETLTAIRERINTVEKDALKNFVRRDSFHELMNQMRAEFNARLDRLDMKIDRLTENQDRPSKSER